MKRYHTLLIRDHKDSPWTIEFGDYSRDVVEDERMDYAGDVKTKIIITSDLQTDIEAAVTALNGKL